MSTNTPDPTAPRGSLVAYSLLACGITWALAAPTSFAWMQHRAPSPLGLACAGLSAFGPMLAALAVGARHRELGAVFGRWRTHPGWIALGLALAPAVNLVTTCLYAATGGSPDAWFHPPASPESWAALVVFPLGEEFGWRGFMQPRASSRYGAVRGSLLVGFVWGVWHLAYSVTPTAAAFDATLFAVQVVELTLYALPFAWIFGRSGQSMAVAIALHVGPHADHLERVPLTNVHLHGIHMLVVAGVAAVAARALARGDRMG